MAVSFEARATRRSLRLRDPRRRPEGRPRRIAMQHDAPGSAREAGRKIRANPAICLEPDPAGPRSPNPLQTRGFSAPRARTLVEWGATGRGGMIIGLSGRNGAGKG